MQAVSPSDRGPAPVHAAAWGAVLAMALGAFALVASEFMPVSLLTPIAHDLRISEGQAGQAISVSGAFALLTSLFISSLAGRRDRKRVLLSLTLLMIVSGTVVAFAPNYLAFIAGRALIGVAIGGFWSMSAATAMRLVPDRQVPRALAIVNGGNALATVVAAPLGSFLGGIVGWRWAFFCVVPVAAIAFGWKLASLPRMHATHGSAAPFSRVTRNASSITSGGHNGRAASCTATNAGGSDSDAKCFSPFSTCPGVVAKSSDSSCSVMAFRRRSAPP